MTDTWAYDDEARTWRPPPPPGFAHPVEHTHPTVTGTVPFTQVTGDVPADRVALGSFKSGAYTFPGSVSTPQLSVTTGVFRSQTGSIAGQPGPNRFWGGLELAHPASTPYLDFHRSADPEEATDFNVRLIHDADGVLSIENGGLHVDGRAGVSRNYFKDSELQTGLGLRVGAAWGKYGIYSESGDVVVGSTTGVVNIQNGLVIVNSAGITATGDLIANNGRVGYWVNANHACFGHKDAISVSGNPLGYMMRNDGLCWIGATTQLVLRISGTDHYTFGTTEFATGRQIKTTGNMWADGKITAAAQFGSTGVYLYNATDTNYRVFFNGASGSTLVGWNNSTIDCVQYDIMAESGRYAGTVRHVNRASNAWKDSEAATHWNRSDPKLKANIRTLPSQAQRVRAIKAIAFEAKDGADPGRSYFGFDATQLPAEVVRTSKLLREGSDTETVDTLMVDTTGLVAMLWQAVGELSDRVDAIGGRP